jgi:hypothetical protein
MSNKAAKHAVKVRFINAKRYHASDENAVYFYQSLIARWHRLCIQVSKHSSPVLFFSPIWSNSLKSGQI